METVQQILTALFDDTSTMMFCANNYDKHQQQKQIDMYQH